MIRRRSLWLTGCILALTTSAVAASTAGAAAYRVVLLPQSVPAGSQSTIRATIHASRSPVGSLNLTPPPGYAVTRAQAPKGAKSSIFRGVVRLRALAIAPGASKVVALTVNAPCSSRTRSPWKGRAKPSAAFAGKRLSPRGSRNLLTTKTTASCRLSFAPQPGSVKVGARISATSFDTTGPAPAVAVIDGRGRRSRSSGVRVALTPAPGSPGALEGGKTRRSVAGMVRFPQLKVASAGSYTLIAQGKRIAPRISDRFSAEQDAVICPDNVSCSTSATQTGTFGPANTPYTVRIDVTADDNPNVGPDGGALTTSFDTQPVLDCRGYDERSPATGVFLGPNREKIVRYTLSPSLQAANPGTLQACVGLPYNFAARLLTRFPVEEDTNGDGINDQFVGQLNDCFELVLGLLITPPCVSERGTDPNGDAFITIRVPANEADPRYRS